MDEYTAPTPQPPQPDPETDSKHERVIDMPTPAVLPERIKIRPPQEDDQGKKP